MPLTLSTPVSISGRVGTPPTDVDAITIASVTMDVEHGLGNMVVAHMYKGVMHGMPYTVSLGEAALKAWGDASGGPKASAYAALQAQLGIAGTVT